VDTKFESVHVSAKELHERMAAAFIRAGLSAEAAGHAADSLTEAECAGKRTHGLLRVEYVCSDTVRKKPDPVKTERQGAAFLGLDGGRHMAYHPGVIGIEMGTRIAEGSGLCFVGIRNAAHSGMLGFFARRIARAGYWGLVMAHCMPLMAPHGGAASVFGTNPVALGVPRKEGRPLVADFSPSAITYGSVTTSREAGLPIPPDCALDRYGRPTTDPSEVMDGGTLLPAAGRKGSALALMVQLLCGPLIGAAPVPERATNYGLGFLIIRPGLFHDAAATYEGVETILSAVTGCAPAEGSGGVRLPGEASDRAIAEAETNGLEVDKKHWDKAGELAGY
jgi:ureidoglycolate dehydrogenase (NAD+)